MITPKLMLLAAAVVPVAVAVVARMDESRSSVPAPQVGAFDDRFEVALPKADRLPVKDDSRIAAAPAGQNIDPPLSAPADVPSTAARAVMVEAPKSAHRINARARKPDSICSNGRRWFTDRPHHRAWRCKR
jgi:hypothetical protein